MRTFLRGGNVERDQSLCYWSVCPRMMQISKAVHHVLGLLIKHPRNQVPYRMDGVFCSFSITWCARLKAPVQDGTHHKCCPVPEHKYLQVHSENGRNLAVVCRDTSTAWCGPIPGSALEGCHHDVWGGQTAKMHQESSWGWETWRFTGISPSEKGAWKIKIGPLFGVGGTGSGKNQIWAVRRHLS